MLNKGKDFFIRNKVILLMNTILIILFLVLVGLYGMEDIREYSVERSDSSDDSYVAVYGSKELAQSFETNVKGINALEICYSSASSISRESFEVILNDAGGNFIQKWNTRRADVSDGWISYEMSNPLVKGKTYVLIVKADTLSQEEQINIRVINSSVTNNDDNSVTFGNSAYSEKIGTVALSFMKVHENVFVILACLAVLVSLNVWWINKNKPLEKYAVAIIMLLGIAIMLIVPPGANHDDDFHYCSTLTLSNIILGKENATKIENEYSYSFDTDQNTYANYADMYTKILDFSPIDKTSVGNDRINGQDAQINPIGHLFAAIGLSVARLLSLNIVQAYTFARMANLIVYSLVFTFAITRLPIKKELILLLAINPMWLQQATSLSYDVSIIIFSLLFVTIVVNWIENKKRIIWLDIIILAFLLVLFGPIKPVYYVHILLLFVIPVEQYKNWIDKLMKILSCVVIVLGFPKLLQLVSGIIINNKTLSVPVLESFMSESTFEVNTVYTFQDVVTRPFNTIRILVNSVEVDLAYMIEKLFGRKLAVSAVIPQYVIWLFVAVLIVLFLSEQTINNRINKIIQWEICIISLIEIGATTSAGFLMTTYGEDILDGLQGRYYIPCVIMLLLGVQVSPLYIRKQKHNYMLVEILCFIYIRIIFAVTGQMV